MNRQSIERALAKYADHKDPAVRARLAAFGPALAAAADFSKSLAPEDVEWTRPSNEEVDAALRGGPSLLCAGGLRIRPEAFAGAVCAMGEALLAGFAPNDPLRVECAAADLAALASPAVAELAQKDPMACLDACARAWTGSEAVLDRFALPAVGLALRAFLDRFAMEATRTLELRDDPITDYDRSLKCPVCGADASFAAVTPTAKNGNMKKLFCSCCGASWHFERIRCAACGTEAVSDLEYVHDEGDDAHRLHVCKACGAATPTLFSTGEVSTFSPEVEAIVMTGLEEAYAQSRADSRGA